MKLAFLRRVICGGAAIAFLLAASASFVRASPEEHSFATEVDKVKDIIIRSLYKTKEIFMRELISNSADAIEKIRVLGLTNKDYIKLGKDSGFNISISPDKDGNRLVISDNGIGMTKEELKKNLGTIGKSGTADFLSKQLNGNDGSNLIGQFGVGFYSVYLVADVVEVITKHPTDKQYRWRSDAGSKFTIEEDDFSNGILEHGTRIILHLKKKIAGDYTSVERLRSLVAKHSEFVPVPVHLNVTKTVEIEPPVEDAKEESESEDKEDAEDDEAAADDASGEKSDIENDKKKDKKQQKLLKPKIKETRFEMQHINVQKPIWMRDQSKVNQSEYNSFARSVFKQYTEPLRSVFFKGEGTFNFRCLLFIPRRPEHSILHVTPEKYLRNIRLFVRRVFITEELIDFLPRFLSFIVGLVDSDDFPLNVSRETIQKTRQLAQIKNMLVNKVLASIEDMAKNQTEYKKFYDEYSGYLKIGVMENESKLKVRIAKLLRFHSTYNTSDNAPMTSLDEYIKRMRVKQTVIYYLTGESVKTMRTSPYVEMLMTRGYEVLLLEDTLDEYLSQRFGKYGTFLLRNVAQGAIEFGDESKDEKEELVRLQTKFEPLTNWLTKLLNETIDSTVVSKRLTTFACAIVAPEHGWTGGMQRLNKNTPMSSFYIELKKRLEINPNHPIMLSLLAKIEAEAVDADIEDLARSLYDMALIAGNYPLTEVTPVIKRIENAVRLGLGVDLSTQAAFSAKPAPEVDVSLRPPMDDDSESAADKRAGGEKDAESNVEDADSTKKSEAAAAKSNDGEIKEDDEEHNEL